MPALSVDAADADAHALAGEAFDAADEAGKSLVGAGSIAEEELLQALYRDLHRGEQAKAVLAETELRQVIAFNRAIGEHRAIDGLGVLAARIPLDMFLAWTAREGPEFWHQADTLDYFEKRAGGVGNPGLRIKTKLRPTIIVEQQFGRAACGPAVGLPGRAAAPRPRAPATAPARRGGRWAAPSAR
jgi:hypothetical protein